MQLTVEQTPSARKSIMPAATKSKQTWTTSQIHRSFDNRRMIREWRFAACALLAFQKIPNALWFEDVITFHGGDARVSELCLLVDDTQKAADHLMTHGYRRISHVSSPLFKGGCLTKKDVYLICPAAKAEVILMSASDWNFDLRLDELHNLRCPWLPRFMDSLMSWWLRIDPEQYDTRRESMEYVANLIEQCYTLDDYGEKVAKNSFSSYLDPLHAELHYDLVSRSRNCLDTCVLDEDQHAYHVKRYNQIKDGVFYPRPYRRMKYRPALPTLVE